MKFAIIKTGGKQYRVEEGQTITIEKLPQAKDESIVFDQVLLTGEDDKAKIGFPLVEGAKVSAKIIEQGRSKKIAIIKYKAKSRYQKINSHRQPFTKVKIEKIG